MSGVCVCSSCGEKLDGFSVAHQGYAVMHRDRADCIRLLRAAHERDLARAYWRGMLAPEIRWLEREADAMARTDADVEMRAAWHGLFETRYRRRAARLRAIADGPMWEPWWERRKEKAT